MSRKSKTQEEQTIDVQAEHLAEAPQPEVAKEPEDVYMSIRNPKGAVVVNLSKNEVTYHGDLDDTGAAKSFYSSLVYEGQSLFSWMDFLRTENSMLRKVVADLQSQVPVEQVPESVENTQSVQA